MNNYKIFLISLSYILSMQSILARTQVQEHSSIYNTPSSSNAIYNGYNLFGESLDSSIPHPEDDDLDVEILDEQFDTNKNRKQVGRTTLHKAVQQDNDKKVKQLLQAGADVNCADHLGWTPLHIAVENNFFSVVKILLDYRADPNLPNLDDQTPLDLAKNERMKQLLLHKQ